MSQAIHHTTNVQQLGNPDLDEIPNIKGNGFELVLKSKFIYSDSKIPGYEFNILVSGEHAGTFTMLMEKDLNKVGTEGNIGIDIKQKFFGEQLPSKVANASLQLFRAQGFKKILITHDSDNNAIAKACSELHAQFIKTLTVEDENTSKKQYILEIKGQGSE